MTSIDPGGFATSFLDKVPASAVSSLVGEMRKSLGAYQSVEPEEGAFRVLFANGRVPAKIHLDADGKIDDLFFGPPEVKRAPPFPETIAELRALPGTVSVLVATKGSRRQSSSQTPSSRSALPSSSPSSPPFRRSGT